MAIRKRIDVKLCLQWERNEYFIPKRKKKKKEKSQLKWAILGCLLSPLNSGFNSDAGGPGKAVQRIGGGGVLDPKPSYAADMLRDFE